MRLASELLTAAEALKKKDASLVPDIEMNTKRGAATDARSKLASAEEKVDLAAKNVDAAKKQLQLYTLTTPHKGRLSRVQAALGQTLALGRKSAW